MVEKQPFSMKIFILINYIFLTVLAFTCLAPLIHELALSFSSNHAASSGRVFLWPVGFTLHSYSFVLQKPEFIHSILITLLRVALGTLISMTLTVISAYPLSKESNALLFRTGYAWFFVFTILFSGGLIPWYMTIRYMGMLNTIWALVIPGAVQVFNVILLLNFLRALPKELEESCFLDGGGYWTSLWKIIIPLARPALATVLLFTMVGHWNSWFDGLILMNSPGKYPLSTYLQTVVVQQNVATMTTDEAKMYLTISDRTVKAAQIFLGALPILLVYPFLQRYFVKGIVMGSIKE